MDSERLRKEIQQMRQNRTPHSKNREYWSKEDGEQLRGLFDEGVGISEIALQMGRTERAVMLKINESKLYEAVYAPRKMPDDTGCLCKKCALNDACENCGCKEAQHV